MQRTARKQSKQPRRRHVEDRVTDAKIARTFNAINDPSFDLATWAQSQRGVTA